MNTSLARYIHGDLVPQSAYHGKLGDEKDDKKNLLIYTMPYLQGKSYFARCWLKPQVVSPEVLQQTKASFKIKLAILKSSEKFAFLHGIVTELEGESGISHLFSNEYPQVLNHMDLPGTNILVNPESFAISGVIDRSLASIQPFGYELWASRGMSGAMPEPGWHDYCSRGVTESAFWDGFWHAIGIKEGQERLDIQRPPLLASKLGLIMDFTFYRTLDGNPLDELKDSPARYLGEWLGSPWSQVLPIRHPAVEDAPAEAQEASGETAEGQKVATTDTSPVACTQAGIAAETVKE
ncbi:uncharacterized protein PG986_014667 [Apiospora aurea]|uniref:Aminoglycoside phosphotransferase domain-containing protein n=1 Tax=Apiospora aurea TaxID=335848 RepID=A0ABR1PTN3_9PEZI